MLVAKIRSLFQPTKQQVSKRVVFLDGDQPLMEVLAAYRKHVPTKVETILVRQHRSKENEPRLLRRVTNIKKVYLTDIKYKKEAVDKFICAAIQKSVDDGYRDIAVVSSDSDFIDIFNFIIQLNSEISTLSFSLIVPSKRSFTKKPTNTGNNIRVVME